MSTEKQTLVVREMVSGLDRPWSIAFISETDWLVTERSGTLRRVIDGVLQPQPIAGLPAIASTGQGGLLDVALHPDFKQNRLVYLSYVGAEKRRYGTEVLVGTLKNNALENVRVIFEAVPKTSGGRHFGSRLAFDQNAMLYISLGDRGSQDNAQQLDSHTGSIVRLHADGTVPSDNPFVHDANARPEIYSYGHRNVQGLVFDNASNTLWAHEHGPQGGDELNQIFAGQNYGWPTITYGVNYGSGTAIGIGTAKAGMMQPVTYWDPSIAPSGLAVVNSERYPHWQGNLLVGALKFQLVARLELSDKTVAHEERLLERKLGRIRDIRQSPDGYVYLLTDSDNGKVYRIE
ncbi:glucose dehydrogenase [Chromatiales bacterium (ex Bugula neritina AB1)]|nr:glucose dehydrogenase [Chromatiales bacterium (ex Bugula neritina AB1)]